MFFIRATESHGCAFYGRLTFPGSYFSCMELRNCNLVQLPIYPISLKRDEGIVRIVCGARGERRMPPGSELKTLTAGPHDNIAAGFHCLHLDGRPATWETKRRWT